MKGVYAEADNMLAGVIVAAQRAGKDPSKLVLVGSNCSIEGVKAIEAGQQYGTVLQSPVDDGLYAAKAVIDFLDGKTLEKNHLPSSSGNHEDKRLRVQRRSWPLTARDIYNGASSNSHFQPP